MQIPVELQSRGVVICQQGKYKAVMSIQNMIIHIYMRTLYIMVPMEYLHVCSRNAQRKSHQTFAAYLTNP